MDTEITQEIKRRLNRIEKTFGVQILFASESGSRAWQFASKNSDYDCRFVYLRPPSWYLSVVERRDVIDEIPIEKGLYDFCGWDLKKALYQIGKSNPVFYEWLISPISYMENPVFKTKLLDLASQYFNARTATYHYLHMAIGNYKQYIVNCEIPKIKKYLYVIRPILACWYIRQKHTMPPIVCTDLFETAPKDTPLRWIEGLLARKKDGDELEGLERLPVIDKFIDDSLNAFSEIPVLPQRPKMELDDLNAFFAAAIFDEIDGIAPQHYGNITPNLDKDLAFDTWCKSHECNFCAGTGNCILCKKVFLEGYHSGSLQGMDN